MVALSGTTRLTFRIAPCGALLAALLAGATCFLLPSDRLGSLVLSSGLPSLLAGAEPPLGRTARGSLALAGGGAGALVASALLSVLLRGRRQTFTMPVRIGRAVRTPAVRRADAHPDAPPRVPILADRDLGMPFLEVHAPAPVAERPLPVDLTTPLSAYDPQAIPRAPVRAPAPLPRPAPLDPGERIETFALSHTVPPEHAHSIETLLARLERRARARGLLRRGASNERELSLDGGGGTFRGLAS